MRRVVRLVVTACAAAALAVGGVVATGAPAGAEPFGYVILGGDLCELARVDLATGTTTVIGPGSDEACVMDLAFSPDGNVLYGLFENEDGDTVDLVVFDTTTGAITNLGPIGTFNAILTNINGLVGGGIAFDAAGILYATIVPSDPDATAPNCVEADAYCTYRVDPANPANAQFVGQTTAEGLTVAGGLAGACDGGFVGSQPIGAGGGSLEFGEDAVPSGGPSETTPPSVADEQTPSSVDDELTEPAGDVALALTNVNRGTGLGTVVGLPFGAFVTGYDFDSAGALWGVGVIAGGPLSVFTIDRATGQATSTVALDSGGEVNALAIAKTCLPELTFTG